MLSKLLAVILLVCTSVTANADLITEIGVGYKFSESGVLRPECSQVVAKEGRHGFIYDSNGFVRTLDCGGDNPIFVGWPIAWDFPNGIRFGLFHYSNWFDGGELSSLTPTGDDKETSLNCLCMTKTFHWNKLKRKR